MEESEENSGSVTSALERRNANLCLTNYPFKSGNKKVGPSGFRDRGKRTEFAELTYENGILSN